MWLRVCYKAHAVIHCHNNLISEQNPEQNLEHWSKSVTSLWRTDQGHCCCTWYTQLCHRIATQSYSTAIISIHRHWVQRSSLIKQLRIVVTGQDSSRSNKVAGPVIRGFINVIFVQHTEYTRKINVLRAHNALIDVGMMMWNIADWMQPHSIYSITTRHIFLNEFGHNLFTVSHDLKYGNMSNVKL